MRNGFVDIFRFILILWIILFHFTFGYNGAYNDIAPINFSFVFKNGGPVGTTIFFILAGWYMGHSIEKGTFNCVGDYLRYCIKRYWRFWPAYFFAVLIIYLFLLLFPLPEYEVGFGKLFVNALLIFHPGVGFVDGAHWFLSALLVTQLVTTLVIFTPPRWRKWIIYAGCLILAVCFWEWDYEPTMAFIYLGSELKLLMGISCFFIFKNWEKSKVLTVILLVIISFIVFYSISLRPYFVALLITIIVMLVCLNIKFELPFSLSKFATSLGILAFPWYLMHQRIGYSIMYHILPKGDMSLLWLIIPVAITLLLAICVDYLSGKLDRFCINRCNVLEKH